MFEVSTFEHISQLFVVFLLLTLNKQILAGKVDDLIRIAVAWYVLL